MFESGTKVRHIKSDRKATVMGYEGRTVVLLLATSGRTLRVRESEIVVEAW